MSAQLHIYNLPNDLMNNFIQTNKNRRRTIKNIRILRQKCTKNKNKRKLINVKVFVIKISYRYKDTQKGVKRNSEKILKSKRKNRTIVKYIRLF